MELYNQLANFFTGVHLKKCGQTQRHFSKLIPITSQRISALEGGTTKPTIGDIVVYAAYLGVGVSDVFCAIESGNHPLDEYFRIGAKFRLERRNRDVARAFGMFDKLNPTEKRAVLKMLNGGEYDAT